MSLGSRRVDIANPCSDAVAIRGRYLIDPNCSVRMPNLRAPCCSPGPTSVQFAICRSGVPSDSQVSARRRREDGSGKRGGSLQCGAACSTESPAAMLSQACWRQRKVKGAAGASQSGKNQDPLSETSQDLRRCEADVRVYGRVAECEILPRCPHDRIF
jgi:hypothetical protein